MLKRISYLIFIPLFCILLFACGGGDAPPADDGATAPPANNTNTNWDQLVWDQDNWR